MSKISIHIIVSLIVILYEFEKGNVATELLLLLILLGFSYSLLINIIPNRKVKLGLFVFGVLILLAFPQYIFLLPLLVPGAFLNVNKFSFLIFIPFLSNFQALYLMLAGLLLLWDTLLARKDDEVVTLREEKYNLIEDVNRLSKSIDLMRMEKERDETLTLMDERNRISREIHDTAGHTLSAAILNLKALSMTTKETETKENILELKETLETGLQDIRRVMYDLRDSSFDLENKIMELLETVENSNLTYIVDSNLSYGIKYDIFAIVREALTNYIKHSDGRNFKVYLVESDRFLVLKINDDGKIPDKEIKEGLGLYSIRKKCEERDWKFNITTDRGFGIHILMERENENITGR
ncbi:MAG: Sensor protein VraS [Firmicutes bacterium ADurb.Bin099]|nr:MAG: Sensor protein VraS [Firmicutes bacterium ADurb.Bin099]